MKTAVIRARIPEVLKKDFEAAAQKVSKVLLLMFMTKYGVKHGATAQGR